MFGKRQKGQASRMLAWLNIHDYVMFFFSTARKGTLCWKNGQNHE